MTSSTTCRLKGSPGNAFVATKGIRISFKTLCKRKQRLLRFPVKRSSVGGCDFPARPDLPSTSQHVLWSPSVDPAVLILMRCPEFLPHLPLRPPIGTGESRPAPEGRYAVDIESVVSQFLFLPGTAPEEPLAALIPLDDDILGRLEALIRYWRAARSRPVPPDTRMTSQQRRRLRLMLQAADGRTNGASYREIAIAIYGRDRIAAEPWKTSSIRDTVIGLVRSGSAMIGGGYLQLLRHRRRS